MTGLPLAVSPRLKRHQRLRFLDGPKYFWTVRALSDNGRYAVCSTAGWKIYTIIDWQRGHRGAENLVFGRSCENDEDAEAMIQRLVSGKTEVSHRNWVWLRFHDTQPSDLGRQQLPELVRGVHDAWLRSPRPYNNAYKTAPWAELGPVVHAFWQMLDREGDR